MVMAAAQKVPNKKKALTKKQSAGAAKVPKPSKEVLKKQTKVPSGTNVAERMPKKMKSPDKPNVRKRPAALKKKMKRPATANVRKRPAALKNKMTRPATANVRKRPAALKNTMKRPATANVLKRPAALKNKMKRPMFSNGQQDCLELACVETRPCCLKDMVYGTTGIVLSILNWKSR